VIDFIMEDNPDIKTRDDALVYYEDMQKENAKLNPTVEVGKGIEDAINE